MFLGAQKNGLIETVLLSTHNIYFGWEIRKLFFLLHTINASKINQHISQNIRFRFLLHGLVSLESIHTFETIENLSHYSFLVLPCVCKQWWLQKDLAENEACRSIRWSPKL